MEYGIYQHMTSDRVIPCFRCGTCCSRHQVRMTLEEAQSIANVLGLAWYDFVDQYIDPSWPGTKSILLRHDDGACVFLEHIDSSGMTSCAIHSFKPIDCQSCAPSLYHRDCRDGLARRWGITVDESGKFNGTEEGIQAFRSFLKSP